MNINEIKHEECKKRLKEFSELGPNWNQYGADPIDKDVIKRVETFLDKVPNELQPKLYPLATEGVQVEFDDYDKGNHIELEFSPEGSVLILEEVNHKILRTYSVCMDDESLLWTVVEFFGKWK